jgi:NADP-dependent 3-hydroxy acid dehydrogenase YdfG
MGIFIKKKEMVIMSKKLVVITGASSGIGKATAKAFSRAGYPLLLLGRRVELMEEMNLPDTLCAKVDVTDMDSFKKAIDAAEEKCGNIDCLINNAGILLAGHAVVQDPAEWKRMFDVNVMGLLNGIHIVLEGMVERECGTIMNVGSIAGHKIFPAHTGYCGTKFAVHAITESIREEVCESNVRVMVVAPASIEAELMNHTTDKKIQKNFLDWFDSIGGRIPASHVAESMLFAYEQPQSVCIREMIIAPTRQQA